MIEERISLFLCQNNFLDIHSNLFQRIIPENKVSVIMKKDASCAVNKQFSLHFMPYSDP